MGGALFSVIHGAGQWGLIAAIKVMAVHGAVFRCGKCHGAVRFFSECHGVVRCGLTVITKVTVFHGAVLPPDGFFTVRFYQNRRANRPEPWRFTRCTVAENRGKPAKVARLTAKIHGFVRMSERQTFPVVLEVLI